MVTTLCVPIQASTTHFSARPHKSYYFNYGWPLVQYVDNHVQSHFYVIV